MESWLRPVVAAALHLPPQRAALPLPRPPAYLLRWTTPPTVSSPHFRIATPTTTPVSFPPRKTTSHLPQRFFLPCEFQLPFSPVPSLLAGQAQGLPTSDLPLEQPACPPSQLHAPRALSLLQLMALLSQSHEELPQDNRGKD